MCNNPGTPVAFQEGGEVEPIFETVAGREFLVGTPGEYRPGIGDVASALMRAEFNLPEQQVAGFVADQERAFELARQGVGSYRPFLERGEVP
jgi:hypothetical protein